ncbi:unnamed protein product [Urochloa humidicola]
MEADDAADTIRFKFITTGNNCIKIAVAGHKVEVCGTEGLTSYFMKRATKLNLRLACRFGKNDVSRMMQANAGLAEVDPWNLPSNFVMRKDSWSSSLRTRSGYWIEKDDFTAIRSQGAGSSSASVSPSYLGVRRTLDFYHEDGTKTDWALHEYQVLDPDRHKPGALFLQEDVVIRKVFRNRRTDRRVTSESDFTREWCTVLGRAVDDGTCGEFPTESASPDGESKVWQHFTRIMTKDPRVVYAACHRCDKVLKAHSSNGTTHLKRHRETCSCNNNPSNAAEVNILHDLHTKIDLYNQEKMEGKFDNPEHNTDLAKLDPWDPQFTPCYFTSSSSQKTHQGYWQEIDKERAAIRIYQLQVPRYVGLKRTLKFHHHNGTKTDWIMLEYHQADECTPFDLLLEGSMVFRKVFRIY